MSSEHWTGHAQSGPLSVLVISIRKGEKYSGAHICPICRYRTGRTLQQGSSLRLAYTLRRKFHLFAHVICRSFLSFLPSQVQLNPLFHWACIFFVPAMHIQLPCVCRASASGSITHASSPPPARRDEGKAPTFTPQKGWFGWGPKSQTKINL